MNAISAQVFKNSTDLLLRTIFLEIGCWSPRALIASRATVGFCSNCPNAPLAFRMAVSVAICADRIAKITNIMVARNASQARNNKRSQSLCGAKTGTNVLERSKAPADSEMSVRSSCAADDWARSMLRSTASPKLIKACSRGSLLFVPILAENSLRPCESRYKFLSTHAATRSSAFSIFSIEFATLKRR